VTLFLLAATAMIVLALGFVILPLLRPPKQAAISNDELNIAVIRRQLQELDADLEDGRIDQARYDAARADLEAELLDDLADSERRAALSAGGRWITVAVVALVPLLAVGLYSQLGAMPQVIRMAVAPAASGNATGSAQASAQKVHSFEKMVAKLAARLKEHPDNLKGWLMLGRSYMTLGRYSEAALAYKRAAGLAGNDPAVLTDYADAVAMANQGNMLGLPEKLLRKALAKDATNPKTLWLMGHVMFQKQDYAGAIRYWKKVAAALPPGSEDLRVVRGQIKEARQHLGGIPSDAELEPIATPAPPQQPVAKSDARVQVEVSLAPALKAKASPQDTVFILARAQQGPPMPLAVVRKQVRDLPLEVTLDDSMAMMPAMALSHFGKVRITARVSKSGQARPAKGDLEGEVQNVAPGPGTRVKLTIDHELQ